MVGGIDMLDAGERARSGEEQIRSFSDIAVLCRTNRQVEEMEEFLKTEGIPYTVTGKGSFLEEENVQRGSEVFPGAVRKRDRRLTRRRELGSDAFGGIQAIEKETAGGAGGKMEPGHGTGRGWGGGKAFGHGCLP